MTIELPTIDIGKRVMLADKCIEGRVTAVEIRDNEKVTVQVSWWKDGQRYEQWLPIFEIEGT